MRNRVELKPIKFTTPLTATPVAPAPKPVKAKAKPVKGKSNIAKLGPISDAIGEIVKENRDRANRHVGGSILPSSNRQILQPMVCKFGTLQVRAILVLDTHMLFLTTATGEIIVAEHPNGYSCHELATRMMAGDAKKVREQAQYILDCGGMTMKIDNIVNWMEG